MTVPESLLAALGDVVGTKGLIVDAADMEPYVVEERGIFRGHSAAVVRPASTAETAEVVRLCAAAGVAVVPQGGNTGLVGGAVPGGGIVLSSERLNRIRGVDALNHTLTAEAGCILASIQAAARGVGCLFPLSLGAEGSCRIGGNLSTNAGGKAVLRYGNARDLVLGLEVVLPDGRVWDGLRELRKDNTGYDFKHLFIGGEGTLGIITAAVLKLFPAPRSQETAMAAAPDPSTVLDLFSRARGYCGDSLTAFEMMPRLGMEFGVKHVQGGVDPFAGPHPYYAMIELSGPRPGGELGESLEAVLAQALEDGVISDAVIATSEAQAQDLWRIRENLHDAQKCEGGSIKHDIAVPVSRVPEFLDRATEAVEQDTPGIRVMAFGHIGDGNIHFNLSQPLGADTRAFLERWDHINGLVHDIACELGGSFSAEHGIGTLKRDELKRRKSGVEMDLMARIKAAFDPTNIMNPGKLIGM